MTNNKIDLLSSDFAALWIYFAVYGWHDAAVAVYGWHDAAVEICDRANNGDKAAAVYARMIW